MGLKIEDLRPSKGSKIKKFRVGRGPGSNRGKTSSRGSNGQGSRSGSGKKPGYEGGQTPLFMRSPKRGFKNVSKKNFAVVNLKTLDTRFEANEVVSPEALLEKGIIKKTLDGVKILGTGTISKSLTVKVPYISKSAEEKIKNAGGKVEVI